MSDNNKPRENLLLSLAFNIAAPALTLSKLSAHDRLGPVVALIVALAFPLGYFVYDYIRRREANFISIIGFVGVLLTGGLGLLKADNFWFAVKEASIPTLIGASILLTLKSKKSLMRTLFFNDQLIDVERVNTALDANNKRDDFEQLLTRAGLWAGASFAISAVLNYALARIILKSPSGTPEFNEELATMQWLSWPVIALPSTLILMIALWRLFSGLTKLSGLELEDILRKKNAKK